MSKKNILILIVFCLVGITSAVVLANKWRNNVNFDVITVIGNHTISKEQLLEIARLKDDSSVNIEELNIQLIQDRIAKHPEIKKVFVSKEPPAELRIEIIEKRPIAILNTGTEMKLIDDELEIFSLKNQEKIFDLPVVSGIRIDDNIKIFNNLNKDELKTALFIISSAYSESKFLYNQLSEVNLSDSSKIIVYSSEQSIPFYFPRNTKNLPPAEYQALLRTKLKIFQKFVETVLAKNVKEGYSYVDLRYTNQVVVNFTRNQITNNEPEKEETGN